MGEESVHGQWQRSVSDVDQTGVMTLAPIRSIFDSKPPFVRGAGGIGRVEFNARSADGGEARSAGGRGGNPRDSRCYC